MKVITHARIKPERAGDARAVAAFRAFMSTLKAPSEHVLFWVSTPDNRTIWRLSDAPDPHLLDVFALQFEEYVEVQFEAVDDVHVSFPDAVSNWLPAAEHPASELSW